MAKYTLAITVDIKKDGEDFFSETQVSHRLDEEQFLEMEQDLFDVKKKWANKSGLVA